MKSSLILFCLFSHISIIISIVYVLHQPEFIDFCSTHHEFCVSVILQEKIINFQITDIIFTSLIFAFLSYRTIKAFKYNNNIINGLISPLIYRDKLREILSENEINQLQIHDTDEIFAYCKGIIRPKIHLSKGIVELLNPKKLDIVILHEKAHIKRFDLFYTFMFKIISIFEIYPSTISYYFHQWKKEKEKACDDEVVKKYSPLLVAQTIIDVALKVSKKNDNLSLNFTESQIIERVERLTNYQNNQNENNFIFIFLWLFLIGTVFLLLNFPLVHCVIDKTVLIIINNIL